LQWDNSREIKFYSGKISEHIKDGSPYNTNDGKHEAATCECLTKHRIGFDGNQAYFTVKKRFTSQKCFPDAAHDVWWRTFASIVHFVESR